MSQKFPVFLDLHQNNCVVIGGGRYATRAVQLLLPFGTQITVISPTITEELRQLDEQGKIRYIPRRYFRGDCMNAYIAIAATNVDTVNIAVAAECKSRRIAVNVSAPEAYGTFSLPHLATHDALTVAVHGESVDADLEQRITEEIRKRLPRILKTVEEEPKPADTKETAKKAAKKPAAKKETVKKEPTKTAKKEPAKKTAKKETAEKPAKKTAKKTTK